MINPERLLQRREENERCRGEQADGRNASMDDLLEEAMRQPLEDPLAKWRREADEQEARFARERRRRERHAQPVNWELRIAEAIADERQFMTQVLAEAFAELTERQSKAINDAVRPLQIELAELKAANAEAKVANAELRLVNASLREDLSAGHGTTTNDLSALPLRGSRAN
jgi:hypothetical protein